MSFNTASVLIQLRRRWIAFLEEGFQYSFCSYSTQQIGRWWSGRLVSIQLLFLFNLHGQARKEMDTVSIQLLFLFNKYTDMPKGGRNRFQYSFCSYSTKRTRTFSRSWKPVSIQLLFLFNHPFFNILFKYNTTKFL